MDRNNSESTTKPTDFGQVPAFRKQVPDSKDSAGLVMPEQIENGIINLARGLDMTVVDGSKTRHEMELRFKRLGREESLYINRKSFWRKEMLKIAVRPSLSETISEHILRSNCAAPLILKGEQREAYSSNYRAFNNKRDAKGSNNEHFGHAWLVDIGDGFSKLRQFLEILSTLK